MSTITRRRRSSRQTLSLYKRHELLTGKIIYTADNSYDGFGDGTNLRAFIGPEMRRDWDTHRAELMDFWKSGKSTAEYFPDHLPWLYISRHANPLPWAARYLD